VEGFTALILAVQKNNETALPMISSLLQFGADPNILTLRRKSALKIACQNQNLAMINLLMDHGVQRRNSAFNLLKEELSLAVQARIVNEEKMMLEEAQRREEEKEKRERAGLIEKNSARGGKNVFDAWVEYYDKKTKKPFYYNTVTRKSTFEKPKEFKPNKKKLVKEVMYGMNFYH
jgi:ankyrin repeat protein